MLPDDLPGDLAMAVMDVCGAPALTARVVGRLPGRRRSAVVGGAGKSGSLSLAAARRAGASRTVGVVPVQHEADLLRDSGAGRPRSRWRTPATRSRWRPPSRQRSGGPADVTVVCVDVPGCEHGAILATADPAAR